MRLAIVRGAAIASIGMVAVCVPWGWERNANFDRAEVPSRQTCAIAPFGAVQGVLASPADLGTSRFEFRFPVDAEVPAERVRPRTRIAPTVEKRPPKSLTQTTRVASTAPLAGLRVSAPRVPKLSVTGIRDLQRELKRLGCYPGPIDGDWGPASRYAATRFTGAVNAALPVDKPEPALLALARRHDGACSKPIQSSAIVTASTIPITRAPLMRTVARSEGTQGTRAAAPKSQHNVWDAPRVVRANGMLAPANRILAAGSDLAPAFQGESHIERRLALGAEPRSPRVAPPSKPKTRRATQRNKTYMRPSVDRAHRARRRSRGRYRTARRSRKSWERRVLQTLNLSAQ
jgi:peptidoglycan hydrolase-like protein with peptidoglycan-binding domain